MDKDETKVIQTILLLFVIVSCCLLSGVAGLLIGGTRIERIEIPVFPYHTIHAFGDIYAIAFENAVVTINSSGYVLSYFNYTKEIQPQIQVICVSRLLTTYRMINGSQLVLTYTGRIR